MSDKSLWQDSFLLESRVCQIISKQAKHGVNYNKKKAGFAVHILSERIVNIDKVLVPQLPMMLHKGTSYKKPFLKSGKLAKYVQVHADKHDMTREMVGGPFTAIWYTPFDPSKNDKLKHVMMLHGWQPAVWNSKKSPLEDIKHLPPAIRIEQEAIMVNAYISKNILGQSPQYTDLILKEMRYKKSRTMGNLREHVRAQKYWVTSPKITPDEDKFEGSSELLGLIRDRMVWSHRRSLILGQIKNIREDGKISASAIPCATPTARMTHRGVVNVPSANAPFGDWCRSLFIGDYDETITKGHIYKHKLSETCRRVPRTNLYEEWDEKKKKWKVEGRYMHFVPKGQRIFVGYDGAGLELRMFAHYINCPKYIHQILEGDIHTYNQHLAGLPTRNDAKTFIYAFLYGGGDAKIGEIVGGGAKEGKAIKAAFFKANPKLKNLIDTTITQAERGHVISIDGRKSWMRRDPSGRPMTHKALNVLLQSAGAIVMKYAMVILDNEIRKAGLRADKVLDIHDEGQMSVHPEDVDAVREIMEGCVKKAGEILGLSCPLASDSMVGASWRDTH